MSLSMILGSVNIFSGLMFGYNTGVVAGITSLINADGGPWVLSTSLKGVITASILIGALVGSMIGGPIADRFGRKVGVIVLAAISIVFAPLLAISPNVAVLVVLRGILGLGVGMSGIICPRYVSENAPPERRGLLGILFQLAITTGILLAYVANAVLEHAHHNWRIMFALGAIPAFLLLVTAFIMPESFVWLAERKGAGGEHSALLGTNQTPMSMSETIHIFLRSRVLYIGLVLAVAQQLTGINAFMFYAQTIFGYAGVSNVNASTIGLGAWNVLSTAAAIPFVNRMGRRPLLIGGTLVMTIACIALGLVFELIHGKAKGYIAIALLLTFVTAFEFGDGPLFWMVAHELFTPEIKTVGSATLNAAQWILNILLCFFFPILSDALGQAPVIFAFGFFGLACTLLMIKFLPETRPKVPNNI